MPGIKTEISEIVTGLGMLGLPDVRAALDTRPRALVNVAAGVWDRIEEAYGQPHLAPLFNAAWRNGEAFLQAQDGLRHRLPTRIEWKGPSRPVGYEAIPADLRIDHVFLVSCKHRSRLLHNLAPSHLFDRALIVRRGGEPSIDWYLTIAPTAYQALYDAVRGHVGMAELPALVSELTSLQRSLLRNALPAGGWPREIAGDYLRFAHDVAVASATRWRRQLQTVNAHEEQLWRLLRLASAPYFILGASATDRLLLRIATPWDWRQSFQFRSLHIDADVVAGQPLVRWKAMIRRRVDGVKLTVAGFVEIRWSHGRFGQPPEAKVQLVTRHEDVPGYFPLA